MSGRFLGNMYQRLRTTSDDMVGEESKPCQLKHRQTEGLVELASVYMVAFNEASMSTKAEKTG